MERSRIGRREAMAMLGAAGAALVAGCGGDTPTSPTTTTSGTTTTTGGGTNAACAVTPTETIGPYPSLTDLIRGDIREGKSGTTLTLTITVVNTNNNCAPVENAQVEIWQCDAAGNYSQYGSQDRADVPARNTGAQQQWRGHVHHHLPGLVPGARDAHPCGSGAERRFGEGHADCVP
jgi:hypothetical protein